MSERKVLQKYFPPDFDPSALEKRVKGPKRTGPKVQTVRLMAPFSMKCVSCGEYIYKGRKFNARKETTDEKYYQITIYRFYIRCTRCSAEITFKTDPKNMDYECESGAKRNFEPWREAKLAEETEEERLDRLEKEEAERDAMKELETKTLDAKTEMQIADALDEIRTRNARHEMAGKDKAEITVVDAVDQLREQQDKEDAEAARLAFLGATGEKVKRLVEDNDDDDDDYDGSVMPKPQAAAPSTTATASSSKPPPNPDVPTFQRVVRKKKATGSALGIKKKPSLV